MSIFERAISAVLKTNASYKTLTDEVRRGIDIAEGVSRTKAKSSSLLKRYVFEYETMLANHVGETRYERHQTEVWAKSLNGAIRKLYIDEGPEFVGLKRILWEE